MEDHKMDGSVAALLELIGKLRGEGGCPWDMRQTPESMKKYLLEECHELVHAIDSGDVAAVREESGDVLFILVFLIRLFEEQGLFDLQAVCAEAHAKMVRRHPHVFAGVVAGTEEELHQQWQAIKAAEKQAR
ncbi:MAG: nucleotide pyrophosphohydrolase [Desulfobulbaceae bacterium]|nr:nucleotide pyrophosphohydrolase [Desulfobulbaceae bacterium]